MDKVVAFEGKNELVAKWSFRVVGKRPPKKGEFYLSGAIPQAYKARTDFLTSEYIVVEPVAEHRLRQVWMPFNPR